MGTRYIVTVVCPKCKAVDDSVYYAPTCDFLTFKCLCGEVVDLEKYTGITEEMASNRAKLKEIVQAISNAY